MRRWGRCLVVAENDRGTCSGEAAVRGWDRLFPAGPRGRSEIRYL